MRPVPPYALENAQCELCNAKMKLTWRDGLWLLRKGGFLADVGWVQSAEYKRLTRQPVIGWICPSCQPKLPAILQELNEKVNPTPVDTDPKWWDSLRQSLMYLSSPTYVVGESYLNNDMDIIAPSPQSMTLDELLTRLRKITKTSGEYGQVAFFRFAIETAGPTLRIFGRPSNFRRRTGDFGETDKAVVNISRKDAAYYASITYEGPYKRLE